MDFDAKIIFSPSSADPALGEALLESFLAADPACDPVVDQNAATGSATVRFSVTAADAVAATRLTATIVTDAAERLARLDSARPTAVHVDPLDRHALQVA